MGLVYRAYHEQLERTGAVKVLQAISPDADTVARFRHEAQAIAQLRHPNIVNVYDFGEFQGIPYMIVEYVPGGSLASRMAHGLLDRTTALKYLRGIASGLDYAHGHGVVHRDVKPANVLLTAEDAPVLADFGLAKLLQGTSLKSMTGVTTGTPAYMAPEQVTGARVGPAADRYSLATIAYEMLTGTIPFDGLALMELLYAQVHREPPAPSARAASLGPHVDAVLMRGLAKDPAARWESCTAFVDALGAAMAGGRPPALAQTMVMAPPVVASTVPLAMAAVAAPPVAVARAAAAPVPGTVAMAYPAPGAAAAPVTKRRSQKLAGAFIAVGVIVALLLVTFVAMLLLRPPATISVAPSQVVPGENVVVTASHLPANQSGQIQLHSTLHTYAFRADGRGNVALDVTVPFNVGLGSHLVEICWNGSCHAHTTLSVVSRLALASATPVANTTPGTTPSATASGSHTPTPGSTPPATSTPTSIPIPRSTPPPSPKPTPKPTPAPSVTLVSVSSTLNTTVTFHNFYGGSTTVSVCQGGTCRAVNGSVSVPAGASSTVSFKTPVGILAAPLGGPAYVKSACCGDSGTVSVGV